MKPELGLWPHCPPFSVSACPRVPLFLLTLQSHPRLLLIGGSLLVGSCPRAFACPFLLPQIRPRPAPSRSRLSSTVHFTFSPALPRVHSFVLFVHLLVTVLPDGDLFLHPLAAMPSPLAGRQEVSRSALWVGGWTRLGISPVWEVLEQSQTLLKGLLLL